MHDTLSRRGGRVGQHRSSKLTETRLVARILSAVEEDHKTSQRSLARELGVALGLVNAYFKRCVKKGLIKVGRAPTSRFAYYLTPQGFAEKSRLTAEYLSISLSFFRQARRSCAELVEECVETRNWKKIALVGGGDLAEIASWCCYEKELTVVAIVDSEGDEAQIAGRPRVHDALDVVDRVDGFIVTALSESQERYDELVERLGEGRVLAPAILGVSRVDKRQKLAVVSSSQG